jgi:uncharacterized membrane protein
MRNRPKKKKRKPQTSFHNPSTGALSRPVSTNSTRSLQVSRTTAFSGPIPPPELLEKYNDIIPEGANRIMLMAEKQQDHRMGLENRVIDGNLKQSSLGLYLGFALSLVITVVGGYLVYLGKNVGGYAALFLPLSALISIFVYTKKTQKKELEERKLTETEKRN